MQPSDNKFPARLLFRATALGMADHSIEFEGHSGTRGVSACSGGQFEGPQLKGEVIRSQSNEWRLTSPRDPTLFCVEGLVLLRTEGGEALLMKYLGRGSQRHGKDSYRIGVSFEANEGPLEWLNELQAVAYVTVRGQDLHFEVHELLGKPSEGSGYLDVEPLCTVTIDGTIGDRFQIHGLVTNRYLSTGEGGAITKGQISGEWQKGFVSGAHRTSRTPSGFPWHLDFRTGIKTDDGISILQHQIGAISRAHASSDPDTDDSWRATAVYETQAEGPMNWLNGIVAIGYGLPAENQVKYLYYTLL